MTIDFNKYCVPYDDDWLISIGVGDCLEYLEAKGVLSHIINDLYLERCRENPRVAELEQQLVDVSLTLRIAQDFIADKQKDDSWSTSIMDLKDKEIAWYREKYNNEYALR